MEINLNHKKYGKITYEESFFMGKKQLYINNIPLEKKDKNTFIYQTANGPVTAVIKGNLSVPSNVLVQLGEETLHFYTCIKWYEYVLSALILAFYFLWSFNDTLLSILPYAGVIGGGISGGAMAFSWYVMRRTKVPFFKLLINTVIFLITVLLCALIGMLLAAF